ncbi:MAG: hypothetical protein WB646_05780 [Steroidobacteraceae bacterium]
MSLPHPHRSAPLRERARNLFTLAAASLLTPWLLSGCVVQPARVYAPPPPPPEAYQPPPPAYSPPPPAQYSPPPADDTAEEQASEPPPPLPDYDQPPCPYDGYIWTPGYWHWSPAGYYWVPGTWVEPPEVGVLWTPGYWGFVGGMYLWHAGYWGPHVGFYGGVNYGFGYGGVGFVGGYWSGGHYAYNTAVTRVNVTVVHNTYVNNTVVNNVTVNKVSYNGGAGGVAAQPTAQERQYSHESHIPPTGAQTAHVTQARSNPALFARANGGHPAIAATARPAAFTGPGVTGARGASSFTPQSQRPQAPGQGAQGPRTPPAQTYAQRPVNRGTANGQKPPPKNNGNGKPPPRENSKEHEEH